MNRKQLISLFARVSRRSSTRAADTVDGLVYRLLKDLKKPDNRPFPVRSTAAGSAHEKQERQ